MMRRLTVLAMAALVGCADVTGPLVASRIVFRLDGATCTGAGTFWPMIDGKGEGPTRLVAGDSVVFTVAPGPHAIAMSATQNGATIIDFTRTITLEPGGSYTLNMRCV